MSTEPKQLTPTQRVENLLSEIRKDPMKGGCIPKDFALELATELERVQKENRSLSSATLLQDYLSAIKERDDLRRQLDAKHDALEKTMATYESAHAQNVELRRQVEELSTQLRAWHESFGTSQLTHAIARLESAEKLRAENAELKRNVEELKRMFEFVAQFTKTNSFVIPRGHNPVKEILWAMENRLDATPEEYENFTKL